MELILETIKALFRKAENLTKANATEIRKLGRSISSVSNTAIAALKKAAEARWLIDDIRNTAENAQATADTALESAQEPILLSGDRVSGVLPMSMGGTEAATRAQARDNLGISESIVEIQSYNSSTNSYTTYSASKFKAGNILLIKFNSDSSSSKMVKILLNGSSTNYVMVYTADSQNPSISNKKTYLAAVRGTSDSKILSMTLLNY